MCRTLNTSVELHCLGGFVLAVLYGLPRPTGDVDYIAAIPPNTVTDLEQTAGRSSALNKKYGLCFQYVTVADVPEDYADRLTELLPGRFSRLRLLAIDVHDLVLAKLVRNSPVDLEVQSFLQRQESWTKTCSESATRRNYAQISPTKEDTISR
jgi:hypothetical protein